MAKLASRGSGLTVATVKDFKALVTAQQRTQQISATPPSRNVLSCDEKKMDFATLIQVRIGEQKGCTPDKIDTEIRDIQDEYGLNETQSITMSNTIYSNLKEGCESVLYMLLKNCHPSHVNGNHQI